MYTHQYLSPLGTIVLSSEGRALQGVSLTNNDEPTTVTPARLPIFAMASTWLDEYFSGRAPRYTPPLDLRGSEFQQKVWQLLLAIPYGTTATYADLAKKIARQTGPEAKMAPQAIGGAVGRNPVAIIVPCHRVLGANGKLTGYSGGGVQVKAALLALEATSGPQGHYY